MSSDPIILFDLPSKDQCQCWSLNPWKTRLVLNYKGIPYKTEWIEYPDIGPKFKEWNIPPQPQGSPAEYTIPAIQTPDGKHIMDSLAIAKHVESTYPSPSLHLDSPYLQRTMTLLGKAAPPLAPVFVPGVLSLLPERSAEYFRRTREKRFGKTIEELAKGADEAWEASTPHLKEIAEMLAENGDGPFVMGKEVSYADFLIVGFMRMFERIGALEGIVKVDREAFGGLLEACRGWMERNDH